MDTHCTANPFPCNMCAGRSSGGRQCSSVPRQGIASRKPVLSIREDSALSGGALIEGIGLPMPEKTHEASGPGAGAFRVWAGRWRRKPSIGLKAVPGIAC